MATSYSELARRVYVCVDACINREPVGRLYSLLAGKSGFGSVLTMLNQIELSLNEGNGPQPTHETRTFRKRVACRARRSTGGKEDADDEGAKEMTDAQEDKTIHMQNENGRQATFVINIRYRQNSTWQGKIQWIEEKKEQAFRSTLEMIKLMDEALSVSHDTKDFEGWSDA